MYIIIIDLEGVTAEDEQLLPQCENVKTVREDRPSANASCIRETCKIFVCRNKE